VSASRQWLILALVFSGGALIGYGRAQTGHDCEALTERAAISKRAADICTGELVGCSLSFEQVERIVAEQEAARGCK
jgi:hypothetical protein